MVNSLPNNGDRGRFLRDGYSLIRDVFPLDLIERLTKATDHLLDQEEADIREKYRYQGSNIALRYQDPSFGELIAWPGSLEVLSRLGCQDPKYWSGYILSKPPHGPPLYWHQDWIFWDDPISLDPEPAQIFLMIYLVETNVSNGCLRVIPGTHQKRILLHDQLLAAHTDHARNASESSHMFMQHPDEVDIEVRPGDLVIGDARVLHAAHANQSDQRRTCITLWYNPFFDRFPESIKASLTTCVDHVPIPGDSEPEVVRQRLQSLKPCYKGDAEPRDWCRDPGDWLRAP